MWKSVNKRHTDKSGMFSWANFTQEALIHFKMIIKTAHGFPWPLHKTLGYSDLEISLITECHFSVKMRKAFDMVNYGEMVWSQDIFLPNLYHWTAFLSMTIYRRLKKYNSPLEHVYGACKLHAEFLQHSFEIVIHHWLTNECIILLFFCSTQKEETPNTNSLKVCKSNISTSTFTICRCFHQMCQISSFDIAHNVTKLS